MENKTHIPGKSRLIQRKLQVRDSETRDKATNLTMNRKMKIRDFGKVANFDRNSNKISIKTDQLIKNHYSRLLNKPATSL